MKFPRKEDLNAVWSNSKVGLITVLIAFPPYVIVNHFFYDRPATDLAIGLDRLFAL